MSSGMASLATLKLVRACSGASGWSRTAASLRSLVRAQAAGRGLAPTLCRACAYATKPAAEADARAAAGKPAAPAADAKAGEGKALPEGLIDFTEQGERTLLKWVVGYYGAHQVRMRKVNHIYDHLLKRVEEPAFLRLYGADKYTFQQWFGVMVLHFWMATVALRMLDNKEGAKMIQELFNVFWVDAETKMFEWGLKDLPGRALILGKQQKLFLKQYLGCMSAYDEGLVYGDTTLAEAVWRNLFYMEPVDAKQLYFFVEYIRKQLDVVHGEKELLATHAHISWIALPKQVPFVVSPSVLQS